MTAKSTASSDRISQAARAAKVVQPEEPAEVVETVETESAEPGKFSVGKLLRGLVVAIIIVLLGGLMIYNMTYKAPASESVWTEGTTIGSATAKRHFVMYTDLACPYCDVFSRLTIENQSDFEQYLADHDILFEIRLTDYLYEANGDDLVMSKDSAEGAYCAQRDGKFMEYYHAGVMALWNDYHSKGVGSSKTAPKIEGMTRDYWVQVGKSIGLGSDFEDCMNNGESADQVSSVTTRAAKSVSNGLPYFQFDKYTTSGFDNTWGYEYVVKYLDAGL